jgi:hypothetical protein
MSTHLVTLRACVLLAAAFAVPARAQNPIELDWEIRTTRRTTLVAAPMQLQVSQTAPGEVVDLSSLGARDTAAATAVLTDATTRTEREHFSAPVGTEGVLTVETSVPGPDGDVVTGTMEVPYRVQQASVSLGEARLSPRHPDGIAGAITVNTLPASRLDGYEGEVGLQIMSMAQALADSGEAEVRFKAMGAVTVLSRAGLVRTLSSAQPGAAAPEMIDFAIPVGERGIIDAEVTVQRPDGSQALRGARLYLLGGHRRVQIGQGGFESLEIAELDDRLARGAISALEYELRLGELLGQGTQQTTTDDEANP